MGVRPDLTCLGKVMGNGYPISALGGRSDVLSALLTTSFTSTYQTDSVGFVVALACLRRVIADDGPSHLSRAGETLRAAFDDAASRHGCEARAVGPSSRLELVFSGAEGVPREAAERSFLTGLAAANAVPTLAVFVSSAMGDDELGFARAAFDEGFARVAAIPGSS
jgi:glutamate-1-semialdehyde 2,1-aminomutase